MQDLQPSAEQRRGDAREQLSTIARSLPRLARHHNVALLIISSVRAERPTIVALKGSGDIEYTLDAGFVLRLAANTPDEWDRLRNGEEDEISLELHRAKNRFGRAGGAARSSCECVPKRAQCSRPTGWSHDNNPPTLPGPAATNAEQKMPL